MDKNKLRTHIFFILVILFLDLEAQVSYCDSMKIYFGQGKSVLETSRMDNKQTLDFIKDRLSEIRTDSLFKLRKISVIGAASPEGSISINRRLSEKRADVLMEYISGFYNIPEVIKSHNFIGRDWTRLISLVKDDKSLPYY